MKKSQPPDETSSGPSNPARTRQPRTAAPKRGRECTICLGEHDESIHAATVSVRQWFRSEVEKWFVDPA
jgi:hypothetical protein